MGFNRRFAPLARAAKNLVDQLREPKTLLYHVNAGPLPPDHWVRDPGEGGGRVLGEGVHFFDFARWLLGGHRMTVHAAALERIDAGGPDLDNIAVTVSFSDGSLATILDLSRGGSDLPKERLEVFGGGRTIVLTDFGILEVHGMPGRKRERLRVADKGHAGLFDDFHRALQAAGTLGVTAEDGYWATWCAEQALQSLRGGAAPERWLPP